MTIGEFPIQARKIDNRIDMSISLEALKFVASNHPDFWDGKSGIDVPNIDVIDVNVFADAVINAINDEDEQGNTLLTEMIDKAMSNAIENGCEGCHIAEDD